MNTAVVFARICQEGIGWAIQNHRHSILHAHPKIFGYGKQSCKSVDKLPRLQRAPQVCITSASAYVCIVRFMRMKPIRSRVLELPCVDWLLTTSGKVHGPKVFFECPSMRASDCRARMKTVGLAFVAWVPGSRVSCRNPDNIVACSNVSLASQRLARCAYT